MYPACGLWTTRKKLSTTPHVPHQNLALNTVDPSKHSNFIQYINYFRKNSCSEVFTRTSFSHQLANFIFTKLLTNHHKIANWTFASLDSVSLNLTASGIMKMESKRRSIRHRCEKSMNGAAHEPTTGTGQERCDVRPSSVAS